jgi:diaminopimelate decarboxylase
VVVRVNPDFELKGSGMKMGGGPKQFGVDVEQVPLLLERIGQCGLEFEGFHLFAGSQNLRHESICEAPQKSYALALQLSQHAPQPPRWLNLGGGFGIPYFPGEHRLNLEPIGENLAQLYAQARSDLPGAHLVIELGRYLVCDGGLHHHLSASGNFGQVIRKNYLVAIGNKVDQCTTEIASVVGPLCTPLDLLADRMALPTAQGEDLVVVFQSGAYGASASPQEFLGHPPAAEVLV